MKYRDSPAGRVVLGLPPLSAALWRLFVKRERTSVDHYRQSASASHTAIAGFCLGEQIWEFLPRAADKEGNI